MKLKKLAVIILAIAMLAAVSSFELSADWYDIGLRVDGLIDVAHSSFDAFTALAFDGGYYGNVYLYNGGTWNQAAVTLRPTGQDWISFSSFGGLADAYSPSFTGCWTTAFSAHWDFQGTIWNYFPSPAA